MDHIMLVKYLCLSVKLVIVYNEVEKQKNNNNKTLNDS